MNLFDYTQKGIEDQANAYAQMTPEQSDRAALFKAGAGLTKGLLGMMGVEDPIANKASAIKLIGQSFDLTTSKGLKEFAAKLGESGYKEEGMLVARKAKDLEKGELERKKTEAEIGKLDAQAEQAKTIKKSNVEATQLREIVTSAETMLEQGQTLDAPTMSKVRYALAVLTKPRPVMDSQTGAIIMTPGLSKEELSPKLAALLSTPQAQGTVPLTGTEGKDLSRVSADVEGIKREIARLPQGPSEARTILEDELVKAQRGVGVPYTQSTINDAMQGATPTTPKPATATVIETPRSIEAKNKASQAIDSAITNKNRGVEAVNRALAGISKYSTGPIGQLTKGIEAMPAGSLAADLDNVRSIVSIETINDMKNQSKTGATGFGSLAVKELELLQSAVESLRQGLKGEQLRAALLRIKTHWEKSIDLLEQHKAELAGKTSISGGNSSIIDKYMKAYPGYSRQEVEAFLKSQGKL